MYHVLLVDDEPRHLSGLSRMLQSLRPEYSIFTAKSGKEALAICQEETFQIIITDIQMPLMDGLDFVGSLPPGTSPLKVIFLSGYGYFDYAQKAIGLGSFEYLLKPLDIDKFTLVLERAEMSIQIEMDAHARWASMEQQLKRVTPVYQQSVMSRWIKGEGDAAEKAREVEGVLGFAGAGCILMTEIRCSHQDKTKVGSCSLRIQEVIERHIGQGNSSCSFFLEPEAHSLITVTNASLSAREIEHLAEAISVIEKNEAAAGVRISIGISSEAANIVTEAPGLFLEAQRACESRFYFRQRCVFSQEQSVHSSFVPLAFEGREASALIESLHKGEDFEFDQLVRQGYDRLLEKGYPAPNDLIAYSSALLKEVLNSIEFLGQEEVRVWLLDLIAKELAEADDLESLASKVTAILYTIAKKVVDMKQHRKDALIYQCLAYIDEHYMEDLSLESVSAILHFSPGYFSNYFKNKLTITFSQYLTQTRLSKAKQLLMESNDKIYQVAAKLGYHDAKYFNRVFKKEFGLTPEEYRTTIRGMSQRREA